MILTFILGVIIPGIFIGISIISLMETLKKQWQKLIMFILGLITLSIVGLGYVHLENHDRPASKFEQVQEPLYRKL